MTAMPETKSPVAAAIERHYESARADWENATISAGDIGAECERSIWYKFRWASPLDRIDGRKRRRFETGHREESRLIENLKSIGCEVQERDPATRRQWKVFRGPTTAKIDGQALNIPGAEKTLHIIECKAMNEKRYRNWRRNGLQKAEYNYFAQVMFGMELFGIHRTLFIASNTDTDEVETERVKYDPLAANSLVAKAERVAFTDTPPERNESFACRWCRHAGVCKEAAWARTNCRTCLHAELTRDGEWRCSPTGAALDIEAQKRGCKSHLFLPGLVPGEQIDADESENTVTYRLAAGAEYVDGRDAKPEAI